MSKIHSKKTILETVRELKSGNILLEFDPIGAIKGAWKGGVNAASTVAGNYRVGVAKSAIDDFSEKTDKSWAKTHQKISKQAEKMKSSSNDDVQKTGEQIEKLGNETGEAVHRAVTSLRDKFPTSIAKMFNPEQNSDQQNSSKSSDSENAVAAWYRDITGDSYENASKAVRAQVFKTWRELGSAKQEEIIAKLKAKNNKSPSQEPPKPAPAPPESPEQTTEPLTPPPAAPPQPGPTPQPPQPQAPPQKKKVKPQAPKSPEMTAADYMGLNQIPQAKKEIPQKQNTKKLTQGKKKVKGEGILPPRQGSGSYNLNIPKPQKNLNVPELDPRFGKEVDPHMVRSQNANTVPPPNRRDRHAAQTVEMPQPTMKDLMSLLSQDPDQLEMEKEKIANNRPTLPAPNKTNGMRDTVRPGSAQTVRPSRYPTITPKFTK